MYEMNEDEVKIEITKINEYLKRCMWMDFQLIESNYGQIEIYGAIDQTYNNYIDNYNIKIVFDFPHFVAGIFSWQLDNNKPFIELLEEKKCIQYITKYHIDHGNYIFKISAEDFVEPPIYLSAKKISSKILKK